MPDVAFKDLCLDASRPDVVAPFWGALLGQEAVRQDNGDYKLVGEPASRTIWVNGVPEAHSVKSRVHLDVRLAAADAPVEGATLVRAADDEIHWRVMADPDGLELCVMGPREGATEGPFELVVDAIDPLAQATWWAARTGATLGRRDGEPCVWLEGVAGFPYLFWVFASVPEPKTVKNRVHWDVTLVDAGLEELLAAGATLVRSRDDEIGWTVLADPAGNEFCAF
jgi:hypothetical protein